MEKTTLVEKSDDTSAWLYIEINPKWFLSMGVENVTKDHAREMVVGLRELTHLLERFMANEDPVKPASGNVYQFKAQRKRR